MMVKLEAFISTLDYVYIMQQKLHKQSITCNNNYCYNNRTNYQVLVVIQATL